MDDPSSADERDSRLQTYCLLTLTIMALGVGLWLLRPVLVPFVLALFFVIGLSPLLDLIQRRLDLSRPAAISVTFVLGGACLFAFGLMLTSTYYTVSSDLDKYKGGVVKMVQAVGPGLAKVGVEIPAEATEILEFVQKFISEQMSSIAIWLSTAILDLIVNLGVVAIFMFFLIAGASSEVRPVTGLWAQIEGKIREYIVTKTIISVFTGIAFGVVLGLMGVPMALQLGVLAFLLNYVPNVGPVIAAALPIPLVLFVMPSLADAAAEIAAGNKDAEGYGLLWKSAAIAAGCAVQVISGNVIEPKIMGDSFELHPIVILLSLILWGIIWGPVGVLLAVPMTAAVKILLDKLEPTRPIAALLAGRLEPLEQAIDREAVA
ncbi:AI-2 transport protein TqsA [Posidoniimonas polymericola]|uniref:AI-2 transport protein TqsA n=1 Tax=Posidoniimonas polymericola TaxID=2528002 RepID=A0A5C5YUB2_9BACT|nr:AI-2E family transporter [Posidoniimonas polymericola]TWT78253.1 AI-2 transport protein TqsA [Posidoniimonas polymericola]